MNRWKNVTQAYRLTPWRKQTQGIVGFLLALLIVALIASIYLNVSARTAESGRKIMMMEKEIERLNLENAELETVLESETSAATIEKRAEAMGFIAVKREDLVYLRVPGFIPNEGVKIAPPPVQTKTVAVALPQGFTESLLEWVKRQLTVPEVAP